VIIFLILNLKKIYSKWNKLKIIIKINPTHLNIEIEKKIEKKLKFNKIMQKLLQ
jgi:hypothetical protein